MNSDPTSLDRLYDIVVPPPLPWWPPAPAWYWILGFLLFAFIALALANVVRWQRNRYRREALRLWREQSKLLTDPALRAHALVSLAELLKRTALSAFPRDQVAELTGAQWFDFLDRSAAQSSFASGEGQLLEGVAYDSRVAATIDEKQAEKIAASVRAWIKYHLIC
jgi:hypothetical protein